MPLAHVLQASNPIRSLYLDSQWCGSSILKTVMKSGNNSVTIIIITTIYYNGDRGSTVVKVLCYKSEGRWFDPSWCH